MLGARIVGGLKLGHIHTPVSLMLRKCSIPEEIVLSYAELPELSLNGSYTSEIYAPKIKVNGALQMGQGFHAAGPIDMSGGSEIAGDAEFSGGHFNLSRGSPRYFGVGGEIVRGLRGVLILTYAQINGLVNMCCGFEAQGAVLVANSSIHGSFTGWGSRFINPNSVTLFRKGLRMPAVRSSTGGYWLKPPIDTARRVPVPFFKRRREGGQS